MESVTGLSRPTSRAACPRRCSAPCYILSRMPASPDFFKVSIFGLKVSEPTRVPPSRGTNSTSRSNLRSECTEAEAA